MSCISYIPLLGACGKALTEEQKIGAGVAIGGVMLYSVIDDLVKTSDKKKTN